MEKKQFDDFSPPDGNPFDKIDRKDPVQFNYAKEQWAKERFVKLEMINIYRERMRECYFRENVNYRQNCRDVIKKYWDAFQEYKKTCKFMFFSYVLLLMTVIFNIDNIKSMPCVEGDRSDCLPEASSIAQSGSLRAKVVYRGLTI